MITGILIATACVAVVGLLIGVFLGIAGVKFKVEVDEREEKVLAALPGNNCGGCGFAGCSGLAAAIAKGDAPVNGCPVGGDPVAQVIAVIMGQEAGESVPMTAFVKCAGNFENVNLNYEYSGPSDCLMLKYLPDGGPKKCKFGCVGGGSCEKVCPFDAIHVKNGVAVVDEDKCKACGKCIEVCGQNVIELIPKSSKVRVACSSKDKGPVTMKACSVGCIGCQLCKKNCPAEAIEITDFCAKIDYDKCTQCGTCVEKCPKKAIIR